MHAVAYTLQVWKLASALRPLILAAISVPVVYKVAELREQAGMFFGTGMSLSFFIDFGDSQY